MSKKKVHIKVVLAVLTAVMLFWSCSALPLLALAASDTPGESAFSAILLDADSGETLFDDDSSLELPIASITKIMTALIIVEKCRLNDKLTFEREWLKEGSSSGFEPGNEYTVRQMLYAMMLASGNDAATGLATFCGGSVEHFAELMNAKAEELGMTHTQFKNPHGLDETGHYSSARDMAILTAYALQNQKFALVVSTQDARIGGVYFKNHNRLLWECDGVIGVKTGYTDKAGRTLVSAAVRNGRTLICVTLNDGNDWEDHEALYNWGFSK
jgi:D-alanyl-D-alanine carboxypeptidase